MKFLTPSALAAALIFTFNSSSHAQESFHCSDPETNRTATFRDRHENNDSGRFPDTLALFQNTRAIELEEPLFFSAQPMNPEAAINAAEDYCNTGKIPTHMQVGDSKRNGIVEIFGCHSADRTRTAFYKFGNYSFSPTETISMTKNPFDPERDKPQLYENHLITGDQSRFYQQKVIGAVAKFCADGTVPAYTSEFAK